MANRERNLHCALARALDLVGDRWTLLVVRELFAGPRRFAQLQRGLPGISPNLLTERLRRLAQVGLVEAPGTAGVASRSYELTDQGRQLGPIVLALARWGTQWLQEPHGDDIFRSEWAAFALAAALVPDHPPPGRVTVTVEEHRTEIETVVTTATASGPASAAPEPEPELEIDCDAMTAYELASRRLDPQQAFTSGGPTSSATDPETVDAIRHRLRAHPALHLTISRPSSTVAD